MTGNPMIPAHDLDAEAAVISAVVLDPRRFFDAQNEIQVSDFYSDANRFVWAAIADLDAAGQSIDVVAVASRLREMGRLERAGGTPYLSQLLEATPAVAHIAEHARTVAGCAYQRRLVATLQASAAEGYTVDDPWAWGQAVEQRVFEAAKVRARDNQDGTLEVVVPRTVEAMMAQSRGAVSASGRVIPTGIRSLDRKLGGGWRVAKYEIAGRPGMGKSALALQAVARTASVGFAAVLVSCEMPVDQIALRLLSQESGVLHARLDQARLRADDWVKVTGHVDRMRRMPMAISFVPAATAAQVRTEVRRQMSKLRRVHGDAIEIGMVAVDHVHIQNSERQRGESEADAVGRLSKANLWLVGEFGCAVLEIAQINRGVETRPDKRPNLSDLRASGTIEEDAHTVLFPFRPSYYDKDHRVDPFDDDAAPDECEIIVAKQRGLVGGSVPCAFHGQTMRFIGRADDFDAGFEDPTKDRYL